MAKIVWKVVRRRGGKRISAIVSRGQGGIEYSEPGTPTIAPIDTKLLAFARRKDALQFQVTRPYEVWRAEAKDTKFVQYLYDPFRPSRFVAFWQNTLSPAQFLTPAPSSTVSCSELTLLEKVG